MHNKISSIWSIHDIALIFEHTSPYFVPFNTRHVLLLLYYSHYNSYHIERNQNIRITTHKLILPLFVVTIIHCTGHKPPPARGGRKKDDINFDDDDDDVLGGMGLDSPRHGKHGSPLGASYEILACVWQIVILASLYLLHPILIYVHFLHN